MSENGFLWLSKMKDDTLIYDYNQHYDSSSFQYSTILTKLSK